MSDRKAIERRLDSYKRRLDGAADKLNPWSAIDEKSLVLAGRFFTLDPDDEIMRDALLYVLADVLFGTRKKGRPRESNTAWNFDRYFRLFQLYHLKKRDNPKLRKAQIAELICEHKEFRNNDPEQIRQHIGRALREHAEHVRRCRELNKRRIEGRPFLYD
ncbi:MAG: hypothetical protein WBO12_15145 [Xanthobacteraceae bacterium]